MRQLSTLLILILFIGACSHSGKTASNSNATFYTKNWEASLSTPQSCKENFKKPVLTNKPEVGKNIRYPIEALRGKKTGRIVIEFIVSHDAEILDKRILSSPDKIFDEPILKAFHNACFEAAICNSQADTASFVTWVKFQQVVADF
ncbi:MAG: TonB family protein [Balneolaceae bacterium]|nr:TonB family protein [Balneolaceae bacterium]